MKSPSISLTIAALSLAFSSVAHGQSASVFVRSNDADGASVIACTGDRVASWKVSSGDLSTRLEWQRTSVCAPSSVRTLPDGGALFVDPTPTARAFVRLSADGAERYRVDLSAPVWGEPLLVDRAVVLRLADGVVQWRAISDGALLFYRRTEAASDPRALLTSGSPLLAQTRSGTVVCVPRARSIECWGGIDGRSVSEFAGIADVSTTSRALVLDVDRDGDDELVVAREDGVVSALHRSGVARWSRTGPSRALVLGAPVAFYQGQTLLIAWSDVDRWVHVVDGVSGANVQGFPRRSEGVSRSGLRVADVDGDGAADVVVSERSGAVSAFRVRDASAVSVGETPSLRAPIDGETALVATGDGVVHWLAIDGAASLVHRAFAATALGAESAVLVDQRDRRPVRIDSATDLVATSIASAEPARSTSPAPGSITPRAVGCSATPSLATEPRAWIALMAAMLVVLKRKRRA